MLDFSDRTRTGISKLISRCAQNILLIILNILADTHGFEGDFAHHLAVGITDGHKNKFGVGFAFEYTKLLKQNLVIFHRLKLLFELFN